MIDDVIFQFEAIWVGASGRFRGFGAVIYTW